MSGWKVVWVCFLGVSTWLNYRAVGKPREPLTLRSAHALAVVNGVVAIWIVTA